MATYTLVKLTNMTPLHIGTGQENYDFSASDLRSDTLSAALAALRAQMGKGEDARQFLESFAISSAFPFVGDRYFLPKPQGKIDIEVSDAEEYPSRKKLKKLQFIEQGLWKELVAGRKLIVKEAQLKDKFLLSDLETNGFGKPYLAQVNQRVTVPREEGKDADPFFFEWIYFRENAGLFCLLDAPEGLQNEILDLFERLGEAGLGTDRNVGGGKFEVEAVPFSLPEIADANAMMLLSLFIPTEEDIKRLDLENARYELVRRGGFIAGSEEVDFRHLRKKSIYMFNTGSIFKTTRRPTGKVVDLRPDWNDERLHPVFRSGKPFVVPIKTME